MPRFVIHIGPPKTASKYLQSLLYYSRPTLLANGINYPNNWWSKPEQINHDPLFLLLREKRYAEVKESIGQVISTGCRIVVLSSEALEDLTPEQLEALKDAIGKNPIYIVYYCRRWSERLPSAWKQTIKTGRYPTFPEYYLQTIRHAMLSGAINYSLVWANIVRTFGRRSLKLVSYNNLRDKKIDIFRHFAENFLDWNGNVAVHEDLIHTNISPDHFDTEIVRALNWIDFQTVGRRRPNMHVKFRATRSSIDTRALEEVMADDVANLELSDGAEYFRLSWKEMQEYTDCLVPETMSRGRLFERATVSMPYVRCNYLLKERAARELRALYKRLEETVRDIPSLK
jgi:hypothetical protein